MLDIGWSELLLIGVVALIVVGPKDLPVMFRTLGRLTARARQMAREFSRAMEDAAKESGLDAADLKNVASKKSLGLDALERATEKFEKWDPKFPSARGANAAKLQADPGLRADEGAEAALDAAEEAFEPDDVPAAEPVAAPQSAPKAKEPAAEAALAETPAPKARKKSAAKKDKA